jgi:hypothetical protein
MSSRFAVPLALGFLTLSAASLPAQPRGPRRGDWEAAQNGWLFNLEEGQARARKDGKPLMVVLRCVP